jgi:hypothetical protein
MFYLPLKVKTPYMPFTFSYPLDQRFLESLYEGDLSYAQEVFAGFLSDTRAEFEQIKGHRTQSDLKKMRQGLHKIKPTFAFVGLPGLTEKVEGVIKVCDTSTDIKGIEPSCSELFKEIEETFAIIETELARMKNHVG